MRFNYKAKSAGGRVVEASIDAASRETALSELLERGLTVVNLESESAAVRPAQSRRRARPKARSSFITGKVPLSEMSMLCQQLSIAVSSGLPLRESLESICEDMDNARLARVLKDVVRRLHEGETFSEAIAMHPGVFSKIFVSLIKAAEEAGSMTQTLEQLASSLEKSDKLARKIKSITAYPIFVGGFFCVICVVMTVFVLPKFQESFASLGGNQTLPPLTAAVFGTNRWILDNFVLILAGIGAVVAAFVVMSKTDGGRYSLDNLKLKLPLLGVCVRKTSIARMCRNLAIMARGGVPITAAIELAAEICGNRVMESSLLRVRDRITAGSDISSSLAKEKVFPSLVTRMVGVGESSGRLPEVMERVSDAYEDQVEGLIMAATSLFEPVMICFFGIVILVLVMAIYVPIFMMGRNVQ